MIRLCIGTVKMFALAIPVLFFSVSSFSQNLVTIKGHAYDNADKLPLSHLMVINKRTNHGVFADADGKFVLSVFKTDTLILSALGFQLKKICLIDSVQKEQYLFSIPMEKLYYSLKAVRVFPIRTLNDIQSDINNLGVKKTYSLDGINALQSPITYLYERFSRFGKSKRKVAHLENEDLKRDILKDLFRLYIKYDIIKLNDDDFDTFIRYLNLSDDFMQNASQLELVMAIKGKYESFKYRWK